MPDKLQVAVTYPISQQLEIAGDHKGRLLKVVAADVGELLELTVEAGRFAGLLHSSSCSEASASKTRFRTVNSRAEASEI